METVRKSEEKKEKDEKESIKELKEVEVGTDLWFVKILLNYNLFSLFAWIWLSDISKKF